MKARFLVPTVIGIILASGAGAAAASGRCPQAPSEQWKPQSDVHAAAEALGYKVANIEVDDGCFEVKAVDKKGKRYELKFNPTDLRLISRHAERAERTVALR